MLRAERPTAPGTKGTALLRQSFSGENVWICAVMEWPSLYPSVWGEARTRGAREAVAGGGLEFPSMP